MGSSEPIKLLDHFESDQVYDFWLIQPKNYPDLGGVGNSFFHVHAGKGHFPQQIIPWARRYHESVNLARQCVAQ